MSLKHFLILSAALVLASCKTSTDNELALADSKIEQAKDSTPVATAEETFEYANESFADLRVLRYQVPGFDQLPVKTKELLYYLSEAALCGRDIIWDQNYRYNLTIRKTLEAIINSYKGERNNPEFDKFMVYAKRVFFSNGIHHHYSSDKIIPECKREYFLELIHNSKEEQLPLGPGEDHDRFITFLLPVIYEPYIAPKKVNLDPKKDLVLSSSVNFYQDVTEKEVTDYYSKLVDPKDPKPISIGLNSKVVKEKGKVFEKTWKVGGMYTQAIEKIVYWMERAITVAENDLQKDALQKLVKFYKSGDLKDFDEYNLAWIKDNNSVVDVVSGFIENYLDPLGRKGSFESVVSVKDMEASKRIATIGANAQWFEDNSPIMDQHKKKNVTGISAKVINAVMESGDSAPSTPIGINLPNSEWIREVGSKSVNLGNIVEAYDRSAGGAVINEFYFNDDIRNRVANFAGLADKLHTDMHEVIGHASGQLEEGVKSSNETLKNYANALEEGRADLVALYYLMDQKLVDLGVMPSLDNGRAAYDEYITNGMITQLSRIKLGNNIEEAHMRNRQMVASWAFEKGKKENVIEKKNVDGKTYFVVNDYDKLRKLFGELLREIQRIKSQGDYKAGKDLIENYGVKVDQALHKEILDRYASLKLAPYRGFIQPKLIPVTKGDQIIDVRITYPKDFVGQMLEYGRDYALLPAMN